MALKHGFIELVEKAEREVQSLSPAEVNAQREKVGLDNVCHMSGGFEQWVEEIGLIEQKN